VARHSRYCTGFFSCPDYDTDALADFLIHLAEDKNLKDWLLLPSNDHAVLTLSRNRARLEAYYKVITPGLDIIENIYDKSRLMTLSQSLGVPIPDTFYAQDVEPAHVPPAFPVLTRGRFGLDFYKATGRKAFLAHDKAELHRQLALIAATFPVKKTLTQSLIPDDGTNKTISFAAFCVAGEIKAYWMGEKLREHPIRFGTATFAKSMVAKPCLTQSKKLLKALNYTGVCEVEYLRDPRDRQYKLIEINARTWLWVGLARACGVDFAKMVYDYVNGITQPYPKGYETGVCWMNPWTDTAYAAKAILQGQLSLRTYLDSLMTGKKVSALFEKGDARPGMAYLMNIMSYLKKR
jgi:predicted ATP-grasp superfamily ATP-dependent carboligase